MTGVFECVPNFSEGRDPETIRAIADAGRGVAGVAVLDVESNPDHNRSVISLVGPGEALSEAVFRMMRVAIDRIDLTRHRGEHPRMGAVDVVPFVPIGDATIEEAVALAQRLAARVWGELRLPVYLYGLAAARPERADLAVVRKGQFEGIRDSIGTDPSRAPDVGDPRVHPTAGIVAIGARPVLIAYNAYLTTPDVAVAKKVARAVRSRDGGLAEVKALGFDIKERGLAQVSMNLTDYRKTPLHRALEAVRREAARYGAGVEESEIVGLVPEDALLDAAEFYLQLNRFDRSTILERKVRNAGGSATGPGPGQPLASATLAEFAAQLGSRTPTPGGGSAAAAAAAFGAALGEMVVAYSAPSDGSNLELVASGAALAKIRESLLAAVDEDSRAYERVRASRRSVKALPDDAAARTGWVEAVRGAAEVPLQTASLARGAITRLESVRSLVKPSIASDLSTAIALLNAAILGAVANVRINLEDLRKAGVPVESYETELARLDSAR